MALLHESVSFKKFDIRMVERNIARGELASQELADFVKALPDDAENAEWVSIESLSDDYAGEMSANESGSTPNGKSNHSFS